VLVGFHGYGENAAIHLSVLERTVQRRPWILVSVQALNRFYTRGDRDVVASWMTREDRESAIADNVRYVHAVVDAVRSTENVSGQLVYAGFSQGASMAYRAAAGCDRSPAGLIILAGDVPPDVAPLASRLPRVLIGRGRTDEWYTPEREAQDLAVLRGAGVPVETVTLDGGHEWTDEFAARAGAFLDALASV
jgi:predicted esterase